MNQDYLPLAYLNAWEYCPRRFYLEYVYSDPIKLWKIEEFHRELKQLTGIEDCQCRKARIQRHQIACALLVWLYLKRLLTNLG